MKLSIFLLTSLSLSLIACSPHSNEKKIAGDAVLCVLMHKNFLHGRVQATATVSDSYKRRLLIKINKIYIRGSEGLDSGGGYTSNSEYLVKDSQCKKSLSSSTEG